MKKVLIMMMCVIMVVCFMPTVAFADEGEVVAKIGDNEYTSLAEAVSKVPKDGTPTTIVLQKTTSGCGVVVESGQNIIFDLSGYSYTVTDPLVGSSGTETNGFQLLKGSTVKFQNGTVKAGSSARILFQNYCNLTLENVTADASESEYCKYVVSNNHGQVSFTGNTNIKAAENNCAFDVYYWPDGGYGDGVSVTVNTTGTIKGKIEYGSDGTENGKSEIAKNATLLINGGTIEGEISAYGLNTSCETGISITGGTFSNLGVLNHLADNANVTVKLNSDVNVNSSITIPSGKTVNLDLNGKTITAESTTILNNGILTIKDSAGSGKVVSQRHVSVCVGDNSVTTIEAGKFEAVEGAVITGYATGATINIKNGVFDVSDNAVVAGNGNSTNGSGGTRETLNTININGGTFNGKIQSDGYVACGIYAPWKDTINVTGGTFNITGGAGIVARAGNVNVSGGTFNTTGNATGKVGDSRVVVPCSAIVFDSEANYPAMTDASKISVAGGTFNSESGVSAITVIPGSDSKTRVAVTGGTFSTDPKEYVASGYTVDGSGPYTVKAVSSGIPSIPTTPTDNVTNSGSAAADNATTSADLSNTTSTSNGTTVATVDKTTADKIVDKAVENKSTEVVIDATANSTAAADSTTTAQVTIPTETLGAIAEKTEADVTIKTDVAEVKMDNAAAAAVSEQAEGDTVKIIAEKVKEDAAEVHFELKVVCSDGKVISDFKGGNIAVTVALPKAMAEKKVVCVYIDDNGHMSKVEGQKNADGTYTFNTGHFSSYAIMAEEEADAAIAAQNEAIKNIKIKLTSKQVKTKTGKKAVKITWTADAGDKVLDGVEVFRSTERYKGYGTEPFYTSTKGGNTGSYTNTKSLKKGTKYYYRVRGYVLVNGEKVYTDYSTKAWRTVK